MNNKQARKTTEEPPRPFPWPSFLVNSIRIAIAFLQGLTDSGCLDNVMEFLVRAGGRSLPEAAMTMVPEAWEKDDDMPSEKKHFYRWAAMSMEPWDGPGE